MRKTTRKTLKHADTIRTEKVGANRDKALPPMAESHPRCGRRGTRGAMWATTESERAELPTKGGRTEGPEHEDHPEPITGTCNVREWRFTLQNTLLWALLKSRSRSRPNENEISTSDAIFTVIENYPITAHELQLSKLTKVLRYIYASRPGEVPGDHEFNFRDRAEALLKKWGVFNVNGPSPSYLPQGKINHQTRSTYRTRSKSKG
ncbi:hypothetical protein B0H14DRAFT_2702861 [Mycena olivaceomarginata]|nr:hypothetical protein B0H14DRAFT_2702861 [Mycena olivaceomarginata]